MSSISIIYTTFGNKDDARRICRALIEANQATCANLFEMESIYPWKGQIQEEQEVAAVLKCTTERREELRAALASLHPYEVPCILDGPAIANGPYAAWIADPMGR